MKSTENVQAQILRLAQAIVLIYSAVSSLFLSSANSQTAEDAPLEVETVEQIELSAELEVGVQMNALQTSPRNGDEASFFEYQRESTEVSERLKRFRDAQASGDRSENVEELRAELQMAVLRLMALLPKVNAPMTWELIESFEAVLLPESAESIRSGASAR